MKHCVVLVLIVSLSTFYAGVTHACLWIHGTTIDGFFGDFMAASPGSPTSLAKSIAMIPQNEKQLFSNFDYEPKNLAAKLNDVAVQTLLRGDAKKAVKMLLDTEFDYPGVYYTAANLGTAYELSGDDEKALKWILEGIKRNANSHMRTEWLHARILEAKIKLKSDADWLKSHTISGSDYSQVRDKDFKLDTAQRAVNGTDLHESLYRQLSVRMLFVKPKDVIVAQLLKELAMCEAQLGVLEQAEGYARLAVQYGMPADSMKEMVLGWREVIKTAKPKPPGMVR